MTLLVRNEDDIIRDNIEYHFRNGVDYFIITDHHSKDSTLSIIEEYVQQGIAEVRVEQSEEHHQAQWVTDMARRAHEKHGADWVINNDADEFWVPKTGNIKDFFKTINPNVYKLHVPRFDFFYQSIKGVKFYNAMLFREFIKKWTKCCHRGVPDIEVGIGNHDAESKSLQEAQRSSEPTTDMVVFHYPVRTIERYKFKMIEGTTAILNTPGIPAETFFHWKRAFQFIQENRFEEYIKEYSRTMYQINDGIRNYSIIFDDRLQKFFYNSPM